MESNVVPLEATTSNESPRTFKRQINRASSNEPLKQQFSSRFFFRCSMRTRNLFLLLHYYVQNQTIGCIISLHNTTRKSNLFTKSRYGLMMRRRPRRISKDIEWYEIRFKHNSINFFYHFLSIYFMFFNQFLNCCWLAWGKSLKSLICCILILRKKKLLLKRILLA